MLLLHSNMAVGAKVASEAEIKAAYKRKALIVHPDKHSDSDEATRKTAEEEFKKIGEALEILGDSMKRGLYDEGFDREAIEERVSRCVPRDRSHAPTGCSMLRDDSNHGCRFLLVCRTVATPTVFCTKRSILTGHWDAGHTRQLMNQAVTIITDIMILWARS